MNTCFVLESTKLDCDRFPRGLPFPSSPWSQSMEVPVQVAGLECHARSLAAMRSGFTSVFKVSRNIYIREIKKLVGCNINLCFAQNPLVFSKIHLCLAKTHLYKWIFPLVQVGFSTCVFQEFLTNWPILLQKSAGFLTLVRFFFNTEI